MTGHADWFTNRSTRMGRSFGFRLRRARERRALSLVPRPLISAVGKSTNEKHRSNADSLRLACLSPTENNTHVMRACNSNFSAWEICHRNSLQLTHMPRTTRTKPGVNMVAKVASHITVTIFSLLPSLFSFTATTKTKNMELFQH